MRRYSRSLLPASPLGLALASLFSLIVTARSAAFDVDIHIDVDKPTVELSPHLYGLFFEDINYAADGGLYAELIQNRSFEYHPRSNPEHTSLYAWEKVERDGARATLAVSDERPLNANNRHYLEIAITEPGRAGVSNAGFDGIRLDTGARYDVAFYARVTDWSGPASVTLTLELPDGMSAGSLTIDGIGGEWKKFEGQLVSTQTADRARFVVTTTGRGTLTLDMVSLFPEDTWRGRKYGLRKDLVQALADLRPRFLRFPGGCIAHGHGLANLYRWKDTVGDVAERKPNWNLWGYHQTYGLGYFEYFQLCEDLGALALPVVPVGVSCGFRGLECVPMDQLQPHIQDVLDLIEFANGPADSPWGSVRARMGHPEPFNLRYVCLGNEEHDTPEVRARFPHFVRALREAHPEIEIIGNSGLSASIPLYDLMTREQVYSSDEHCYELPEWFLHNQHRFDSFDPRKPKIFVGEYASWGNCVFNAIAEAAYLTGVERNGDIVDMAAYAPLLARAGRTQWNPNLIYFDQRKVLRTANYYVQQLFAQNKGDVALANTLSVTGTLPARPTRGHLGVGSARSAVEIASITVNDRPAGLNAWSDKSGRFATVGGDAIVQSDERLDYAVLLSPAPVSDAPLLYRIRARKTSGATGGLIVVFGANADGGGGYVWSVGEEGKPRHRLQHVLGYDHWLKQPLAEVDGPALAEKTWHDITVEIVAGRIRCAIDGEAVIDHTLAPHPLAVSSTLDRGANELIVKLVNPHEEPASARIALAGTPGLGRTGRLITLSGGRDEQNFFERPDAVVPVTSEIEVADVFDHKIPAMSVQILRVPLSAQPSAGAGGVDLLPFRDPDLPIEQRVEDLIARLTVQEKVPLLMMGNPAIPRLGIPAYHWWNEALHGVARNGTATVFPQAIALAATWNTSLHRRIAEVISTEARAKNNEAVARSGGDTNIYEGLTIWSPNINIFRDPRWGRGQETYGEDPFLTSRFAVAFVKGLQGEDPRHLKTVATVKHFAVHSGPEPERHLFDAVVSERDLWETYLPAFEAGIREGGAQSLMSAYNAVNGIPAPAHTGLLHKIVRERWGFTGAVVGDVDNVSDIWREGGHRFSPDAASASAAAIRAGNDLCSGGTYWALPDALARGLVTEGDLDGALRRLLTLRFRVGHFDPPERVSFRAIPPSANNAPAHDQLALEAARQSLVLLKNDDTLPFDPAKLKTVAVLGPTASEVSALLGNYSGTPLRHVTLADGIRAKLEPLGVKVVVERGAPLVRPLHPGGNTISAGVLFTDASRVTAGLRGEIFAHDRQDAAAPKVEGRSAAKRTDLQVNLYWNEAQPAAGIPTANTAARWTGVLVPPVSGEYRLGLIAEGAVRLHLDDRLAIDSWKSERERALEVTLSLEAGRAYAVRLDYVQLTPTGRIQLGWIAPGRNDELERALATAREADHIVLALGITPDLEGEEMSVNAEGFRGGDRLDLALPAPQRELLAKVTELGKPVAVVLTGGSAISLDDSQVGAVLLAWYYGQRGADAVAEALLGETNPAGRLPVTFYRDTKDLPDFADYSMRNRTYRYYTGDPLYAFGHGLSYTTFSYEKIGLSASTVRAGDTVQVSVTVKNTGARDGDEVVQIYATAGNPPVPMPLRQLVGFARVPLKAGETKTVAIDVPVERLRRWDETADDYIVDPGAWRFAAGPASDSATLAAIVTVLP
jgi:beta-glucosidase